MLQLFHEIWRVRWPAGFSALVVIGRTFGWLPDTWPLTLVAYKISLAALGFISAHIAWQQAFWFIDTGDVFERAMANDHDPDSAVLFTGVAVLRGLIYASFVLGVTLGL